MELTNVSLRKSNIVEVIYRHSSVELTDLNCSYLKSDQRIPIKKKNIFPAWKFYCQPLDIKYNEHNQQGFIQALTEVRLPGVKTQSLN